MQQEFDGIKYIIRLDDGSVVAHPSLHCLWPHAANGWLFYPRGGGLDAHYVAREIATGLEKLLTGVPVRPFEFVANSQQANLAVCLSQAKAVEDGNIAVAIFDFASKSWLDFSALTTLDVFRMAGAGQKPNWLWAKNDGGVTGYAGNDPCQAHSVLRMTWKAIDLIEFSTIEWAWPSQFPLKFHLWQRRLSPTGLVTMTEIIDTNPTTLKPWPVDRNAPKEPTWLSA